MKVSEVEAEFHRRISEVREEFRGRISDLQAEFCRVNSATEGVEVPAVSLPSNETKDQEEWRVVSGAKRRKVLRATQRVETENSFAVLKGVEEEKEEAGSDEVRRVEGFLPAGKIMLIGDSQVRHLDAVFCDKDRRRRRRTRVCLPRAGIERVSAQLDTCLADGTKPIVFLSAGGMTFTRSNGLAFIDNWDLFYGKGTLYARDGVHLSRQGVRGLAGTLEDELNALQPFFRWTGKGRGIGDP
ncbi:hypothetical protein E2C01_062865 [Portunus trituberculatus]|uniref:SGNH domain-containing protein n=1 Tax=Portunus trituberculatus TaxID=210409 RepID=A0A5B7H7N8_PORTR|nr:hypothetical protein [Portunus trituberculatus]